MSDVEAAIYQTAKYAFEIMYLKLMAQGLGRKDILDTDNSGSHTIKDPLIITNS